MTQLNRFFRKTSVFLLIFSMLVFSLTGCRASGGKTYESWNPENESTQAADEQEAFNQFTREIFCEQISENTLNLHYILEDPAAYGISDYPLTLGEFSQKASSEACERAEELRSRLKQFDYSDLTSDQKLTYDILDNSLELDTMGRSFPYYEEVLQPSIGLQSELPTLFAEYTLNTEKDISDYLALLEDVERYFKQIITYEQEKSAAGLFMSDYCADMVIKDCESFISQTEDNFLIATFKERLDEINNLDASVKEEYINRNHKLVTENMVNAYQLLIDALKKLKGTGVNDGGICNFEHGTDYYEYILKQSVGTDRSVKQLENMTIEQINADLGAIKDLLKANPQLQSGLKDFKFTLTDPEKIIEDLQVKMQEDFPELKSDVNLQIKYVSKSMEESLSPAFYLTPPIDNLVDNVIYINNGSSDSADLYTTLAHEGYPGHLYQTVYASASSSSPIRRLCCVSGYSEGWATYVENLAYSYETEIDPDLTALMQHNNSASLGIYALLDFYINYEGKTPEEIYELIQNLYDIEEEDDIKEVYYYIVSQPCNYLNYYVGYLEFLDLKADAQKALGETFNLKDFHTFLLETGNTPFYLLRQYMNDWIKTCQAGS